MNPVAESVPAACKTVYIETVPHYVKCLTLGITGLAVLFAAVSLIIGFKSLSRDKAWWRVQKGVVIGLWLLVPPTWFFVEYLVFYRRYGIPECFEHFKYAQDLATKGWAGMVAVLGVLFFNKDLLNKDE